MNYEDILVQGLDDSSSEEKRDLMIDATLAFYLEMKSKMKSGDPQKRQEAIQKMTEIQALLTARRQAICETTGLTPEQLDFVSRHPAFGKEHAAVAEAKSKLQKILNSEQSHTKRLKDLRVQV